MSALPRQYNVDSPEELGRRIRAARKAQGLTQVDLAEIAGVADIRIGMGGPEQGL